MGRQKSQNRILAFELYKEKGGKITSAEIAAQLGEKVNNINSWRSKDKWKDKVGKVGAPYGNKNAVGNSGGGAPILNKNSYIHGFYSKHLPRQMYDIMKDMDSLEPIDILWQNIRMKFAAIIRSQKIMYVKNQKDTTRHLKKIKVQSDIKNTGTMNEPNYQAIENYREEEYEIQFAWDKQATFLNAQSRAMGQLTNMIRRYDEMLHNSWDLATDEQKLRIERLKKQIENPELEHQKAHSKAKLQLEKDRLEHQKEMDKMKAF